MSDANPLLEARSLDTYYGASHVLRGVDFRVGRGETVSLLGRNGMGKTTLLRSLMGLTPPRNGELRLNGADVMGWRPSAIARAGVGFVPEGRGIFPNLTVEENLVFAARTGRDGSNDWTRETVFELFPRLAERRSNWGNQLSGGEQQMLTIGRALMSNPSLLLVDEATEGLAPLVRDDIWRTLRLIAEKGVAIVVVDKNLDDLKALCRRHVILVKGEVVFEGSTEELAGREEFVRSQLGL
jgi:branched-chain amino acid transport system ATP-binding protein